MFQRLRFLHSVDFALCSSNRVAIQAKDTVPDIVCVSSILSHLNVGSIRRRRFNLNPISSCLPTSSKNISGTVSSNDCFCVHTIAVSLILAIFVCYGALYYIMIKEQLMRSTAVLCPERYRNILVQIYVTVRS
jgi:hypothetical protein